MLDIRFEDATGGDSQGLVLDGLQFGDVGIAGCRVPYW